ncbi:MAG: hypothetical protein FK734_17795 [Asgard group archaeon]|nr:hypothetical protein [Asgard group archaeon]
MPAQAEVVKIEFTFYEKFDFSGYDPGTTVITGSVEHTYDAIYKFNIVYGPIEGVLYATADHMVTHLETGEASGVGTNELIGVWLGDDQFYGMNIYFYGNSILKRDGITGRTYGWCNSFGTLGPYTIKCHAEYGPVLEGPYVGTTYVTGVMTIHL